MYHKIAVLLILVLLLGVLSACVPGENKSYTASATCSGIITLWSCNISQTTQADEVANWLALGLSVGLVVLFWLIVFWVGRGRKPQ